MELRQSMCDKHKKFLARINAGQILLYAMSDKNHQRTWFRDWKSCSFEEFLEASSTIRNKYKNC